MSNETDSLIRRVDSGSYLGYICLNGCRTLVAVSSDSKRLYAYCVSLACRFCGDSSYDIQIVHRENIGTPSTVILHHIF